MGLRLACALGLFCLGAGWLVTAGERGARPAAAPAATTEEAPPPPARLAAAPRATALPTPAARSALLELPDGTYVPCLNGAVGAPPLRAHWGSRPYSPIVGVERTDRGLDWYVHGDGTRTTTEMKWRPDLGRFDAMTRIGVPVGTPPPVSTTATR